MAPDASDPGFPLELIGAVIDKAGVAEKRRRLLPAASVMIFVLGLALFSADCYGEVARKLAPWLGPLAGPGGWRVPGSSALARARRRLGPRPFELLFRALAGPLADPAVPGTRAFGRQLLMMSVDGTTLDVPASPAALAAYGPPPSSPRGPAGYPQLRLLTLIGCGTRGLAGAVFGPRRTSEQELCRTLAGRGVLAPGMLVLADRNFSGHTVVAPLAATGADLLIRARADQLLPVVQALPDGSAATILADPAAARRRHIRNHHRRARGSALPPDTFTTEGIGLRLIEADITTTLSDGTTRTEHYRLITTITDYKHAPAADLAALYAQRWESETGYRELKTFLHGPRRVLRSGEPALIEQETWALLCAGQLIQATRAKAAAAITSDPDRISYTVTLRALRRQITTGPATPRHGLYAEILSQLLPPRRPRSYPRLTRSAAHARRTARPPGARTTYQVTITPPAPATGPSP
jgi:transposase IS4-like protein/DDE family transposase